MRADLLASGLTVDAAMACLASGKWQLGAGKGPSCCCVAQVAPVQSKFMHGLACAMDTLIMVLVGRIVDD